MALNPPSKRTLDKYGWTAGQFCYVMDIQNYSCAGCDRRFDKLRSFIDHDHVKGFKAMSAQDKSKHVRGILCFTCNRYRVAKNNLVTATNVFNYLQRHEDKLARLAAG